MRWIIIIIAFIIFAGCSHISSSVENEPLFELGVVISYYDDGHLKLTVNGKKVLDEVVYVDPRQTGVSTQFVIKTSKELMIEFCVEGECIKREFTRSKKDIYLTIDNLIGDSEVSSLRYRTNIELYHDLGGYVEG